MAARIARREITARAVTEAHLARIAAIDPEWRSYTTVTADHALAMADRADRETARGISRGPLHGVPVGVKDLADTTFAPTGAGTMIRKDYRPARNATIVDRLEQGGAVILGKLAMTEGAYAAHHPRNPSPLNPWSKDHWVGSSSTGSGVGTAAGLCYAAIGSDTGGSIRLPSATCNLTGIKPSWGRVSRSGVFPLADSLDHLGPMARNAADAAAMLGVVAGLDPADPTTIDAPVEDYLGDITLSLRGVTIGIDRSLIAEPDVDAEVVAAVAEVERALASLGARIVGIAFPDPTQLAAQWNQFCAVETAIAHKALYPGREAEYGPALAGLIERGRRVPVESFGEIYHERLVFSGALASLFTRVQMVLVPTIPFPLPSLAQMAEFGKDERIINRLLRFTAPFDFSGTPTITLPAGLSRAGLPLSVQLAGPRLSEVLLCRAGHALQQVTDWHTARPPAFA